MISGQDLRKRLTGFWQAATGGNTTELAFIALSCCGVGAAIAWTARTGFSRVDRGDLRFETALTEVGELISNRGPRGVATHVSAVLDAGGSGYRVDTLALVGDSMEFASLARGGFLHDQLDRFNDHAIRRAVGTGSKAALGRPGEGAASIFQLARTDSGEYVVSPTLREWVLTVPSPFAEQRSVPVRTADRRFAPAMIGSAGTIEIPRTAGVRAPMPLNRQPCRTKGTTNGQALLYCRSEAGIDVDRGYDLRLERGSLEGGVRISTDLGGALWRNGRRLQSLPATGRSGDILYRDSAGSLLLSDIEFGTLAEQQWVNGKVAFSIGEPGTLRFFGRAGRHTEGGGPIVLSFDAAASRELDARLDRFVRAHADFLAAAAVVVADLRTGEVRAIAETGRAVDDPLTSMEPVLLGSMVKPILAAALLSRDPRLADLKIANGGPLIGSVAGVPLRKPFRNPANGCPGTITFEIFLQCSSNQYAAELLFRSLQRSAPGSTVVANGRVVRSVLEHSPLTNGLLALFDDVDVVARRANGRTVGPWEVSSAGGSGLAPPRDRTLHPWLSRPWFILPSDQGTPVDWLARFSFGGWENRWTLLGAAEAYARIATGMRVRLTLRHLDRAKPQAQPVDARAETAFRSVRRGLAMVGQSGTAAGLNKALSDIRPAGGLRVLSKTGTLNEVTARLEDDDVYLKAIAIVVGSQTEPDSAANIGAALDCGLVAIARLEFRQDWRERVGAGQRAALPDLHRKFASGELAEALRGLWATSPPCGVGQ